MHEDWGLVGYDAASLELSMSDVSKESNAFIVKGPEV